MDLADEEQDLYDDFLRDGEYFCDLVLSEDELPVAKRLQDKGLITLYYGCEVTATSTKGVECIEKLEKYIESLEQFPKAEFSYIEQLRLLKLAAQKLGINTF